MREIVAVGPGRLGRRLEADQLTGVNHAGDGPDAASIAVALFVLSLP